MAIARRMAGPVLVAAGTISIPVSQWFVFWLLAQYGGAFVSGQFAVVVAVCTPIFTLAGFGLRNVYITLSERFPFSYYLLLRAAGIFLGVFATAIFASLLGLPGWLVAVYLVQKSADSLLDMLFALLQRRRALVVFGALMLVNGVMSVLLAGGAAVLGADATGIVGGASVGSAFSLITGAIYIAVCRQWRRRPGSNRWAARERFRALGSVVRHAVPVAMWQFLAALNVNIATWTVAIFGTGSDVGRYAGAAYLVTAGSLFGAILNSIFIGEYRALVERDGSRAVVVRAKRHVMLVLAVALVLVAFVVAFGGQVLTAVYGAGFALGPWQLLAIGTAAALSPGSQIINAAQLALNRYVSQARISVLSTIATIVVAAFGLSGTVDAVTLGCMVAMAGGLVTFSLLVASMIRSVPS